jgi:hypothetical protein
MPCPPTYEELEMMRLDRDHAEVWQALEQLWPQVAPTLALAQALVGTDRKGVTEPELDRALTELASYAANAHPDPQNSAHELGHPR